jgi:ribonuclease P protein component
VAFSLSRALGPAVTRNLLRRRLRSICRQLDAAGQLPAGLLLIGATPRVNELTFAQIEQEIRSLISQITVTTPPVADERNA